MKAVDKDVDSAAEERVKRVVCIVREDVEGEGEMDSVGGVTVEEMIIVWVIMVVITVVVAMVTVVLVNETSSLVATTADVANRSLLAVNISVVVAMDTKVGEGGLEDGTAPGVPEVISDLVNVVLVRGSVLSADTVVSTSLVGDTSNVCVSTDVGEEEKVEVVK